MPERWYFFFFFFMFYFLSPDLQLRLVIYYKIGGSTVTSSSECLMKSLFLIVIEVDLTDFREIFRTSLITFSYSLTTDRL